MNTKIFSKYELSEAAAMIRAGGLVAMPTETVYGLAANALDENAVRKIYKAKGRESDNPLIVHIADIRDWKKLVTEIPRSAQLLAQKFWPGPLTIILKKSDIVPSVVSGGLDTVAVRMPKNKIAFNFIKACGCPLAAPSANISGRPSPTKLEHVVHDLNGRVDGIIDGGKSEVGVESTVISLAGEVPMVLRPGRITVEQLREVLGEVKVHHAVTDNLKPGEKAASPGMKYKHYSPKADVCIVDGSNKAYESFVKKHADSDTAVICFDEQARNLQGLHIFKIGSSFDSSAQAQELFDVLRAIDDADYKKAFAPMPSSQGVGLAVVNRLLRAAGFKIIDLAKLRREKAEKETARKRTEINKKPPVPAKVPSTVDNISDETREIFAKNIKTLLAAKNKEVGKEVVKVPDTVVPERETKASHRSAAHYSDDLDYEKYARELKAKAKKAETKKAESTPEQPKIHTPIKEPIEVKEEKIENKVADEPIIESEPVTAKTDTIAPADEENIAKTEPALVFGEKAKAEKESEEKAEVQPSETEETEQTTEEKPAEEPKVEIKDDADDSERDEDGIIFELATEPSPEPVHEISTPAEPKENEIILGVSEVIKAESSKENEDTVDTETAEEKTEEKENIKEEDKDLEVQEEEISSEESTTPKGEPEETPSSETAQNSQDKIDLLPEDAPEKPQSVENDFAPAPIIENADEVDEIILNEDEEEFPTPDSPVHEKEDEEDDDFDILSKLNDIKFDSEFYDDYAEYAQNGETEDGDSFEKAVEYDIPEIEPLKESNELPGESQEFEEVYHKTENESDFLSPPSAENGEGEDEKSKKKTIFRKKMKKQK